MKLKDIVAHAIDKNKFSDLKGYIEFCRLYLDYIGEHLQAVIVSQNETHYRFFHMTGREIFKSPDQLIQI